MEFAKRTAVQAVCLVVVASLTQSALAQVAVPAPAPATLWNFLGFPKGFLGKARAQVVNRRGNLPGLEKKPPLKNLADPENLKPEMPKAIQEAAKIKQAEDMAPQKIKAIKYLGTIGCGCYPGVKEGLLAALDDCTEDVRYAAVMAFIEAAGNVCQACSETCCDEEVVAKLKDLAFGLDDQGCPKEPSARVRGVAAQAAQRCEAMLPPPMEPIPNPEIPDPERGRQTLPPPVAMTGRQQAVRALTYPQRALRNVMDAGAETYPSPASRIAPPPMPRAAALPQPLSSTNQPGNSQHHLASLQPAAQPMVVALPKVTADRPAGKTLRGAVSWVGPGAGNMRLKFPASETPLVGEELRVYHDYLTGRRVLGRVQVIGIGADGVWARPLDDFAQEVAAGDAVSTMSSTAAVEPAPSVAAPAAVAPRVVAPKMVAPRRPTMPEVRVTDAAPVSLQRPIEVSDRPRPVVEKHLPPRPTANRAVPITRLPPARIFDAPQANAAQDRPLPMNFSGRLPTTKTRPTSTAVASTPIWVGDNGKQTKSK